MLGLLSFLYTVITAWSYALVGDYTGKYTYTKYYSFIIYAAYFTSCVILWGLPLYPSVLAVLFCLATCYYTKYPRLLNGERVNLHMHKTKKLKK